MWAIAVLWLRKVNAEAERRALLSKSMVLILRIVTVV